MEEWNDGRMEWWNGGRMEWWKNVLNGGGAGRLLILAVPRLEP